MTPEMQLRGHLVELRFFAILAAKSHPRPWGYISAAQASPHLDVNGIDGFIYHERGIMPPYPCRLPIQLKSGHEERCDSFSVTRNGMEIPLIKITTVTAPYKIFAILHTLLQSHRFFGRSYEHGIREIERREPNDVEKRIMADIVSRRKQAEEQFRLEPA